MPQITSDQRFQTSDDEAIALAQASIDRCEPAADQPASVSEMAEAAEIQQLATTLDLLGQLGVGPLAERTEAGNAPIMIGRFRILNEQGRGGFGIVLRAYDPDLQREVALKIPRPERLMTGHSPNDFIHEAQVAAHLEHPGIVRVYEAGRLGPLWYIASGYCAGPTMAEWLDERESALPPRMAAQVVAEVAEAVQYAHSRGVLHLDLKPENILLEISDGSVDLPRPLVTDFGLAGRSASVAARTSRIAGTLAYMAPEQRSGDSRRIGVATDVYALGAVLHELLNGRPNLRLVASAKKTACSCPASHPPLPPVRTTIPADLDAVCRKCLREDPSERYGSAQEMVADLRHFLRGEAVTARTASWPERLVRRLRRRPLVTALSGVLAALAVTSLTSITHLWRQAESNLARLRSEQEVHAQTSDRMRASLLNLTWLIQANRLQQGQFEARNVAELSLLRAFYEDVRGWTKTKADQTTRDAALHAASHSLALVDGLTPLSEERINEEFKAGLSAWRGVIDQEPTEPGWKRALALHFFTYAARYQTLNWLWWRTEQNAGAMVDPTFSAMIAEPYATLLVEFADQRGHFHSPTSAYEMLRAAITLLEERSNLPDPSGVRNLTLLAAYNHMTETARLLSRADYSRDVLAKAEALASAAPSPAECPPQLAICVAETHNIRSRVFARNGDFQGAIASLEGAIPYFERAISAFRDDAEVRLSLVGVLQRVADIHARQSRYDQAILAYRAGIASLETGITHLPRHRTLTQRRAAVSAALADCLLCAGDEPAAQVSLETAVRDYADMELRNEDSHAVWMQSIRCWQKLGKLYAKQGRTRDAVDAYEKSLDLLEVLRPRRGTSRQFKEYVALSRDALTKLAAQTPHVESSGKD